MIFPPRPRPVLKSIVGFTDVAPGATVSRLHLLREPFFWWSVPLVPDIIFVPSVDLDITVDDTRITITNLGPLPFTGKVLAEYWHSPERFFPKNAPALPVRPYVVATTEDGDQPPQPEFRVPILVNKIYARLTGETAWATGARRLRRIARSSARA